MEGKEEEKMITIAEAASELGVAVSSIYRYIEKYKFQTFRKVGDKHSYLKAEDIQRLKGFIPKG